MPENNEYDALVTGPFSEGRIILQGAGAATNPSWEIKLIEHNLQKGNASYSGSKLQVPALQLLACIRC